MPIKSKTPDLILLIALLSILLLVAACEKKTSHSQVQLQRYLRQIPQMESFRIHNPMEEWDTSVEGFQQQVKDYEHRLTKLELMKPMQGELRPLHDKYISANRRKLEAWRAFIGEIEGGDLVQRMDAYRFAIDDANLQFRDYYAELRALCELRSVDIPENLPEE